MVYAVGEFQLNTFRLVVATSIQPSFSIVSTSSSAPSVEVEMDPNGTPICYATSASTNVLANSRRDVLVNSLGGHHDLRVPGMIEDAQTWAQWVTSSNYVFPANSFSVI